MYNVSGSTLSVTTNMISTTITMGLLILDFTTCGPSTPYLLLSTKTCYDTIPPRSFVEYNEIQNCPYDCYTCTSNTQCATCSADIDFRTLDPATNRCVPLSGYYETGAGVTIAAPAHHSASLAPPPPTAKPAQPRPTFQGRPA